MGQSLQQQCNIREQFATAMQHQRTVCNSNATSENSLQQQCNIREQKKISLNNMAEV